MITCMSELFWEGLRRRSVGPLFREEEARITQHWRLGLLSWGGRKPMRQLKSSQAQNPGLIS